MPPANTKLKEEQKNQDSLGRNAYFTVLQAAQILHVSPSTIWRWIKSEKLPGVRWGDRTIRVRKTDLKKVMQPAHKQLVNVRTDKGIFHTATQTELRQRRTLIEKLLYRLDPKHSLYNNEGLTRKNTTRPDGIVIDSSAILMWFVKSEEYHEQARQILFDYARGGLVLVSPTTIYQEVASFLSGATQGRNPLFSQQEGKETIQDFLKLNIKTYETEELLLPAYRLVGYYECDLLESLYLALAQRLGVPYITANRQFYLKVRDVPSIIWIGYYTSPFE